MTLPNIPESMSLDQQDAEETHPSQAPPHELRRDRAPRYRCGTCGFHTCSCINLVQVRTHVKRLARAAEATAQDLVDTETSDDYPQQEVLAIQAKHRETPSGHHIVITIEKIYSSIGPGVVPQLETTLKVMHKLSPTDCLTYRLKEWTWHEKRGLEFAFAANVPPLPPSMVFGKVEQEDAKVAMVRCITAHQLW